MKAPPEWGIERVPAKLKSLGIFDYFVLWSSLGVGLLVFQAGAYLTMPFKMWGFQMDLTEALIVSLLGSIIGSILLGLVGIVGAKESIPTMVSLRPSLGLYGSYIPSILNIIQLIGWTSFELLIMGEAAASIIGIMNTRWIWTILFGVWCLLLAIWGPSTVIRQWLEKFAIWLVYLSTIWITYMIFSNITLLSKFTVESFNLSSFLLALDLVIAMPISWVPLVSDYNRFSNKSNDSLKGTFSGYTLANTWFYFLGGALYLTFPGEDIVRSISILFFGNIALLLILVDETDNAFADIYSAAVSIQNIDPKIRQWISSIVITIIGIIIALIIPLARYEDFLYLIGASFIPITSILLIDYFIVRNKVYDDDILYNSTMKINVIGVSSWLIGFITYYYFAYILPLIGATIPSLIVSGFIYYILARFLR